MNKLTSMLFRSPQLDARERDVLDAVERLHAELRINMREPQRWMGSLRRDAVARSIQGSNSIEGYNASLDDAAAVEMGEEPLEASASTASALKGYRDAMTFVLQQATEDRFAYNDQLIKSLHFMMVGFDLTARPGRWRVGPIYVENQSTREIRYEGADAADVADLMTELFQAMNESAINPPGSGDSAIVAAAMAHLNLVMVHPFRDGNGRMARCLQTLVLAREGIRHPEFSSIEEYLGSNTEAYYDVLRRVGGDRWDPSRDARQWVRFILTAHLRQGQTVQKRFVEGQRLWFEIERLVEQHSLPERTFHALYAAASRYRVRNATYRALVSPEAPITEATASRDLRLLSDTGLLTSVGEKRSRHYVAGPALRQLADQIRSSRVSAIETDPFE